MTGSFAADLRHSLRGLARSRGFAAVAVASLALGIGANSAIFSLLDQVLLRRLPVHDPDALVLLNMNGAHYGSNWGGNAISYPMYADLSRENEVFSGMFCRFPTWASLSFGGETERVSIELVSGSYFPVLGVGAALGRSFDAGEDRVPGGHPYAMLSHAFWQVRFGADPGVLGETLVVNGHNLTVVGVAEPGFRGVQLESAPQIFVPMMMKAQMTPLWDALADRRWRFVNAFGRLRPGVTRERAQASLQPYFKSVLEMEVAEPAFRNASPEAREAFLRNVLEVLPGGLGRSYLRGQLEAPLALLMALTAGVLLIACANIANLLVSRAAAREREVAVRRALGATRTRIARLLLSESLILAALGAAGGLLLAWSTTSALVRVLPPDLTALQLRTAPDLRVLLFTGAVTLLTAFGFGLLPLLKGAAPIAPALKEQAGAVAGGQRQARLRKLLVGVRVALSLLLLAGSGLFLRSLLNLRELGPGFPTRSLLAFNLDPSLSGYSVERSKALYRQLQQELAALPGASAVGLASMAILQGDQWDSSVTVEGYQAAPGESMNPYMNSISPGYFAALGVPLLEGRDFTLADTGEVRHGSQGRDWVPQVVIANRKFARRFFGGASPLGRHVGFGRDPGTATDMEIVGVVDDIKYTSLRDEIPIQMFVPYLASRFVGGMSVYLRSSLPQEQIVDMVRQRVRALDPNLPLYGTRTMEDRVTDSLLVERLVAGLSSAFGLLATVLACVGLYGVLAYGVVRRSREFGVRMALGARSGDVVWLVLREAALLVGAGLLVGLPATVALGRYAESHLFGVEPADPLTLALAAASLTLAAALAGYLPARRASGVDPIRALRHE